MKHFLLEFLENLPLLNRYEAKAACDDILGYLEPLADHMADEVPALLLADPTAQHYDPDRGFWVAPHSKQWFWWNELNGYEPGTLNLFLPERISNILQDSTAKYPLSLFFMLCSPRLFFCFVSRQYLQLLLFCVVSLLHWFMFSVALLLAG